MGLLVTALKEESHFRRTLMTTYLRCTRFVWNKDVLEVGVLVVAGGVLVGVGGGGNDLVALVDLG